MERTELKWEAVRQYIPQPALNCGAVTDLQLAQLCGLSAVVRCNVVTHQALMENDPKAFFAREKQIERELSYFTWYLIDNTIYRVESLGTQVTMVAVTLAPPGYVLEPPPFDITEEELEDELDSLIPTREFKPISA